MRAFTKHLNAQGNTESVSLMFIILYDNRVQCFVFTTYKNTFLQVVDILCDKLIIHNVLHLHDKVTLQWHFGTTSSKKKTLKERVFFFSWEFCFVFFLLMWSWAGRISSCEFPPRLRLSSPRKREVPLGKAGLGCLDFHFLCFPLWWNNLLHIYRPVVPGSGTRKIMTRL